MDITASRAQTIAAVSGQAERRNPGYAWPWIALAAGAVLVAGGPLLMRKLRELMLGNRAGGAI